MPNGNNNTDLATEIESLIKQNELLEQEYKELEQKQKIAELRKKLEPAELTEYELLEQEYKKLEQENKLAELRKKLEPAELTEYELLEQEYKELEQKQKIAELNKKLNPLVEQKANLELEKDILVNKGLIAAQEAINKHAKNQKELEAYSKLYEFREKTLAKARVTIPELLNKSDIGADLKEISLRDFSSNTSLFNANQTSKEEYKSEGAYHTLNVPQRIELLEDLVGFYSGFTLDPRTQMLVQSNRDLWHKHKVDVDYSLPGKSDSETNTAAKSLGSYPFPAYRIPHMTGYITNDFTFSKRIHQQQISNVRDIGGSLTIGGGTASGSYQGALSGAYRFNEQKDSSNFEGKQTVYLASSFMMPKIELFHDYSLTRPDSQDRVNPDFISEMERSLDLGENSVFYILDVLNQYGHYAARSIVIGGRLVAFQSKTLDDISKASDTARQHLAAVKIAVDTPYVNVEGQFQYTDAERSQKRESLINETQHLQFRAVGGQGSLITSPNLWSLSLSDYRGWRVIESRDLFPSIMLLTDTIRTKVVDTLRKYVQNRWISDLLALGHHFLLEGEYFESIGKYAKQGYFMIRSGHDSEYVLTVPMDLNKTNKQGDRYVLFEKYDKSQPHNQQWCFSPLPTKNKVNGEDEIAYHIISRGQWEDGTDRYLTASIDKDTMKVVSITCPPEKGTRTDQEWVIKAVSNTGSVKIFSRKIYSGDTSELAIAKFSRNHREFSVLENENFTSRQEFFIDFVT